MTTPPPKGEWIAHKGKLCRSGSPIQIEKGDKVPYLLLVEGRDPMAFWTVEAAKSRGDEIARDLAGFDSE